MKRASCFILFCLMQIALVSCSFSYPMMKVDVCSTTYTVTPALIRKHGVRNYRLTIEAEGLPKRKMILGTVVDQHSRAPLLRVLRDSLRLAYLFPPCPGQAEITDAHIDKLITDLIWQVFPFSNVKIVDSVVIDDNHILKLLQEIPGGQYKIVLKTPAVETPILSYNMSPTLLRYEFEWGMLEANPDIVENFDGFLKLYYNKMLGTAVKPRLYLLLRALTGQYEIVYSYGRHAGYFSHILLSKEMGEKLAGPVVNNIAVGASATPTLYTVINPNNPPDSKKPKKDDPTFKEEQ
jgi:hypothetical protein